MNQPTSETIHYADAVLRAYEGEVFGEAFFARLAENATEPTEAALWQWAHRLEALTKGRLEPIAARLHGDLEAARQRGLTRAREEHERCTGQTWRDLAEYFLPRTPKFIEIFERMEAEAPAAECDTIRQVTGHSRAFGDFLRLWLAGNPEDATVRLRTFIES